MGLLSHKDMTSRKVLLYLLSRKAL